MNTQSRPPLRAPLSGAFATLALLALAAGALPRLVPTMTPFGALARMLDSLAPGFLVAALLLGLCAAACGLRRIGSLLALAALICAVHLAVGHARLSLPLAPDRDADVKILFFNALKTNTASAERIVDAALARDPDIVVFAEAAAIQSEIPRLQAAFAFVSPCDEDRCELLVASKVRPKRFWQLQLNPAWEARYAVAEFERPDGTGFFLAASQIAKPWLDWIAESELQRLIAQYNWLKGPVVAVGDFNSAPWSRPMRDVLERTGLRALRFPHATWPAKAGALGIPIDHILVRGGTRVTRTQIFAEDLGSNHRGFLAEIALPPKDPAEE